MAEVDGYEAILKNDLEKAMQEFNRSWRMDPQSSSPYWCAAIVFGLMAEKEKSVHV